MNCRCANIRNRILNCHQLFCAHLPMTSLWENRAECTPWLPLQSVFIACPHHKPIYLAMVPPHAAPASLPSPFPSPLATSHLGDLHVSHTRGEGTAPLPPTSGHPGSQGPIWNHSTLASAHTCRARPRFPFTFTPFSLLLSGTLTDGFYSSARRIHFASRPPLFTPCYFQAE